ncbi:MAG: VWA domain-containing protein, partial [Gammaproteobacteria bacterium]
MSERFPSCVAAAVLALAAALSPVVAGAAADVRVLIDVSGSMKQNDPANLRVPAMRLVSELLPVGTRAGVWLFAEGVEPLIAPSTVDDAWRRTARAELDRIHSRGLFTHIEAAIDAAAADWSREGPADERHIVLLTDGMVDVSKNPADSASSRERILGGQLERVRAHGARVHAVALSDNVDRELLEALTDTTGGLLERAEDAERLQRIFLHMLEQTAAPVTVPLEGKQFDIDASVSELTLLIFRNEGEAVLLFPPGGGEALAAISP